MHPDYEDKLTSQAYVKRKKKGIPVFPSSHLISRSVKCVCVCVQGMTQGRETCWRGLVRFGNYFSCTLLLGCTSWNL